MAEKLKDEMGRRAVPWVHPHVQSEDLKSSIQVPVHLPPADPGCGEELAASGLPYPVSVVVVDGGKRDSYFIWFS